MTIDEAIKHAKEVANNYGDYREVQREIKQQTADHHSVVGLSRKRGINGRKK